MTSKDIVIVGGGLAAQRAIETLRARGHDGPIRLVCAEPVPPYDRPPLSKDLLASGGAAPYFRAPEWYAEHEIDLLLGCPAVGLEPAAARVLLGDGTTLAYGRLLIATGGRPRALRLPGAVTLRGLADARALHARLRYGSRLAIVGGGFIGQEVAATARGLGVDVTMIEALDTPLARVLPKELGRWFADLHRAEGVRVELGVGVAGTGPAGLALTDGRHVEADTVLVAVGTLPDTEWAGGGGAAIGADATGRTAWPGVWAAGDAAGCDHWEPAARQGAAAARSMLGLAPAPSGPTSFWTDQYGVRIQLVGDSAGADRVELDGDATSRDFTAVLSRGGREIGALLVGRPHELPDWRRRLAAPQTERIAA